MSTTTDSRPPLSNPPHLLWQFLLLTGLTCLVYWPSLQVPFYFDDFRGISENLQLHDASDWGAIWAFAPQRFVGSLTFALNYALHGDAVLGYHLVNLLIHLLAGCALWILLAALIRSPALGLAERPWLLWIPLIATLIFLIHPLQTQAVTYVVQRYASLAAMFYLASLAAYAWGRLRGSWSLLLLAVGLALLALFTKQNAATIFGALLLLELLFFQRLALRGRLLVAVATVGLAIGLLWAINLAPLDQFTRETQEISRSDYFATQMGVIWRYLLLFVLPLQQRLEYDVALAAGLLSPAVLLAAAGHLALIIAAFAVWRRSPLVAFGVLFYYLAHLVESSVIPISDLVFEHRNYLPNAGLATALAFALGWLLAHAARRTAVIAVAALLLAGGAWLTFSRNSLWQDPIAFLQQETRLSPGKERAWTSLGKELMRRQRFEEALKALGQALNLSRTEDGLEVSPATLLNAVFALHYTGQHRKGFELARLIPIDMVDPLERSRLHEVRGMALNQLKRPELARRELELAISSYPNLNAEARLAHTDLIENRLASAIMQAGMVLQKQPGHPLASDVLARAQAQQAGAGKGSDTATDAARDPRPAAR